MKLSTTSRASIPMIAVVLAILSAVWLVSAAQQPTGMSRAQMNAALPQDEVLITVSVPMSGTTPIPIAVKARSRFTVTLASNHTTGYQWRLAKQPGGKIVSLVGSVYNEPANTGLVGQGGTETWTFRAVGKGSETVTLEYVRPWEKGVAPIKTQAFRVTVQ